MKAVLWFDQIRLGDTALVGGKGANLGEFERGGSAGTVRIRRHR